jgi:pimeloyl-ACP methyl ester carboxylesterase
MVMFDDSYYGATMVHVGGGTSVAVVERGSGPPVLLLHGIPLSLLTWRHNVDPLAEHCTVYALDMLGYGRSDKPAGADYSVPALAGVVRAVLDQLGVRTVSLVGSSFGCAVAVTFASLYPERADKLVLINPVCYPQGRHSATRLARIGLVSLLARTALRTSTVGRRMIAGPLRRSYANQALATAGLVAAHHRQLVRANGERTFLATLRSLDEAELAGRIPGLTNESLVIWGERDHVLPSSIADRLLGDLRGARLELLPTAGHLPHEEEPDRVNELIATFVVSPAGDRISDR